MKPSKRAGLVAGAGIGAAAAISLRRRWGRRDEGAEGVARLGAAPGEAGEAFLDHLAAAVRIPTVSHEETERVDFSQFLAFRDFLNKTYPLVHSHLEREIVADHSLLYTWRGFEEVAKPIVVMAHQDVVPVEPGTEEEWELAPFGGERDQQHLYGRGTLDDKGSLIAILEAVEGLLSDGFEPTATVYVVFGHDEETGGTGAAAIAALLEERGVHASLVVDEGGAVAVEFFPGVEVPIALVGIGEKGYADIKLTARGTGGHSSAPPPSTAIGAIAAAIRAIETNPMPARLQAQRGFLRAISRLITGARAFVLRRTETFGAVIERRMSANPMTDALIRTTAAATMVGGGVKSNVLPQEASALVNFRIMPGDSLAGVLEHVRSLVGPEISVEVERFREPPPVSDPASPEFELLESAIREHFSVGAVAPWILTGATDSRSFVGIADQVLRFEPFVSSADDFKRFHGTGERIRLADADAAVGFFRTLIERAAGSA